MPLAVLAGFTEAPGGVLPVLGFLKPSREPLWFEEPMSPEDVVIAGEATNHHVDIRNA